MERATATHLAPSLAPEHDWPAASRVIHPALRPVGTSGTDGSEIRVPGHGGPGLPLVRTGPAGLPVVYVIPGQGFDVLVGMEHLLSWGVTAQDVHGAAMANLAGWSAQAQWVEETDGGRRVVWSDSGEGMDAARILLPEVRRRLADDLGSLGRILVGLPERDLLIATTLTAGDAEFASMFGAYVADRARDADEPVEQQLFELVAGELVAFEVLATA